MSTVRVEDGGSGVFGVAVEFSPEECERLPFNALCRVGATVEAMPQGGARATASFNVCDAASAGRFVEALALFGADGLIARGAAGPAAGGGAAFRA